MRHYAFTAEAEARLEDQIKYLIEQDARQAAKVLLERVTAFIERTLCARPAIGRYLPDRQVYEFWIPRTRLVLWYRYDDTTVTIISVWHTAQNRYESIA
jgi:plasmid stabilization system protein ParE